MDDLGLEPARKLLQLLEPAGESGVRIDQLPDDLLDPRLLTVLDGAELIEFGQRQHCKNGIGELIIESGFWWKSWLGPNTKPIKLFLPELLEREPEILRPFVRLTSQGRLAAARIGLIESSAQRSDKPTTYHAGLTSAALQSVVDGGLAGVLCAAVRLQAGDRATAMIREELKKNPDAYDRTAEYWAGKFQMTKKTIIKCDGWREIMRWRESNRAERVSKQTRK